MKFTGARSASRRAAALGVALAFVGSPVAAAEGFPTSPPNIVFILADDLGWRDVGFNGSEVADTPALDQLSREGMRFTHAYAPAPICSASRAAILTGRSPARLSFEFVTRHPEAPEEVSERALQPPPITLNLPLSEVTIPEVLESSGYTSAFFGKWHVSAHYDGKYLQWSPTHGPMAQGFTHEVFDFGMHPYNQKMESEPADSYDHGEFPADSLTDQAVRFIHEAGAQQPFLLYLSHFYVHDPVRNQVQWLTDKYAERLGPDEAEVRAEYAASVEIMDHHIGSVIRAIDESGLRESTVVVFFSDNGGDPRYARNAPLRGHKWTLYEGGVRVPMLVRWPGVVSEGTTCNTPVIGMDFLPTFAEIASVSLDPAVTLDGESIMKLLRGNEHVTASDRQLVWHFPYYHGKGRMDNPPTVAGINDPIDPMLGPHSSLMRWPWKLVHWYETGTSEVFDLERDPSEQADLSDAHGQMRDELHEHLMRTLGEAGARLPTVNPAYKKPEDQE